MSPVPQTPSSLRRPARIAVNAGLVIFLALYAGIAFLQPNYLEPGLFMNFLRRAAPLVILACGQLYVILTGGFDLSMGAVATLVVLAASILINGDPETTWAVIGVLYVMGIAVGLVNGLVVAFLKVPSIIATERRYLMPSSSQVTSGLSGLSSTIAESPLAGHWYL